jgi:hypothetical protein
MKAYKKEVWFTIIMSFIFLVAGHMGFIFSFFNIEGYLFGFPITYIVPILVGWFGILILTVIAGRIGNQLDDEIEAENVLLQQSKENTEKGAN